MHGPGGVQGVHGGHQGGPGAVQGGQGTVQGDQGQLRTMNMGANQQLSKYQKIVIVFLGGGGDKGRQMFNDKVLFEKTGRLLQGRE